AIEAVGKLIAINTDAMGAARDQSVATADYTRLLLVIGATARLLLAFAILGWIAYGQIARPLWRMTLEMTKLAGGDLDISIVGRSRTDEIGGADKSLAIFQEQAVDHRRRE